jgi:hypothetical protein
MNDEGGETMGSLHTALSHLHHFLSARQLWWQPLTSKSRQAIKASHESTFKHVGPALLIFSIASSVWVGSLLHGWSWFSYHPTAMIIAYIAMAGNSALIKKIGGKTNTEIHGYMMTAAAALSAFGWYVIYTNKDMNGKPHNKTWHAWSGVATAAGDSSHTKTSPRGPGIFFD